MQKEQSKQICDFLKANPIIAIRPLENALKLPITTISNALSGKQPIAVKHLKKISLFLEKYGYES